VERDGAVRGKLKDPEPEEHLMEGGDVARRAGQLLREEHVVEAGHLGAAGQGLSALELDEILNNRTGCREHRDAAVLQLRLGV